MDGQLKNSGLTLGDIDTIRISFIDTLKGRFHVRVRYPGNEQLEAPSVAAEALPEPVEPDDSLQNPQQAANALLPQDISSD